MNLKEIGKTVEKGFKEMFSKLIGLLMGAGKPALLTDIKKLKAVIVFRPDRLGDFILSVPAIKTIEASLNYGARFVIVTGNRGGEGKKIARMFFDKAEIVQADKNFLSFVGVMFYLLTNRFDAAVDLHSYPFSMTSGLFTMASRAKIRVGFVQTGEKNNELAGKIYNRGVVLTDNNLHETEKNMLLALALGAPRCEANEPLYLKPRLTQEAVAQAEEFYGESGISGEDYVAGIHPTLKKKDNRWEKEKYRQLIMELQEEKNAAIVVVYGKMEEDEAEEFRNMTMDLKRVFFIPQNDIMSTLAYAARFNVFICNDSGIMHAVSLVAPTLAIFGPTSPRRWKPVGNLIEAVRAADNKPESLSVRDILKFL